MRPFCQPDADYVPIDAAGESNEKTRPAERRKSSGEKTAGRKIADRATADRKTNTVDAAARPRSSRTAAIVLILALALTIVGSVTIGTTTLITTDDNPPSGYLPVSEYSLVNTASGSIVTKAYVRDYPGQFTSVGEDGNSCRIDHEDCDFTLATQRGIRPGDGWNAFVRQYGNMTADEIIVSDNDGGYVKSYMSDEDRAAERNLREHYNITVAEFDRKYIQAGKIDLAQRAVTVTFQAKYKLGRTYYTAAEQWEAEYGGGLLNVGPLRRYNGLLDFDPQTYIMEFDFGNNAMRPYLDDGDLISISVRLSK
ncbi:hypothetical protein JS532_06365 [Bifidobacterium callimiconis]|uniref:hypothetical protein n=1 Tax=Bifidobacterium callimiconis TaxID=2306973 RepID=UPI001BDCC7D2|nr:hypothetical protein [Bifidobacterium callimiconis]MBT1177188.1 hypothetical protein [Bifidobacterium callimiconis]